MLKISSGKIGVVIAPGTCNWAWPICEQPDGAYVFAFGALYRRDKKYITAEDEVCIKLMGYEIRNYVYNFS